MAEAPHNLTGRILIGMLAGLLVGVVFNMAPVSERLTAVVVDGVFDSMGQIFLNVIKMLVVPLVFVSLVCGTSSLTDKSQLGRLAMKSVALFLTTTIIAITLAILFSTTFEIGKGANFETAADYTPQAAQSLKDTIIGFFPTNPFQALVEGQMLQVIFIAIFFGIAITLMGKSGQPIARAFQNLDNAIMKMVMIVMDFAPYGVFCLMAVTFTQMGFSVLANLAVYIGSVFAVLLIHALFTYGGLLKVLGRLPLHIFYKKVRAAAVFGFATSSSNAAIPVMLDTVERKLGVKNSTAAFTIPLGATVNMDGTAIMQGIAVVFIANIYNVDLGMMEYLLIIASATFASIGTAGAPSAGILILAMVLQQVGLPVEGIALIIGVDRLVDMARTSVNVIGNCAITCLIAKSEETISMKRYTNKKIKDLTSRPKTKQMVS